jgi:hypothetical protein
MHQLCVYWFLDKDAKKTASIEAGIVRDFANIIF